MLSTSTGDNSGGRLTNFSAYVHEESPRGLQRSIDQGAQGPRARQAAARHVHAHREPAAHHPGSHRQRLRRGARRLRQADHGHAARRPVRLGRGRRPRHPVRPAPRRGRAGRRDRLHAPARGRQVRQGRRRRLHLLGRPARRGRLGHQRAGHAPGRDGLARRQDRRARLRARRRGQAAGHAERGPRREEVRHARARLAGRQVFRFAEPAAGRTAAPAALEGRAAAGRGGGAGHREDRRAPELEVRGRPARLPARRDERQRAADPAVRRRALRRRARATTPSPKARAPPGWWPGARKARSRASPT